MLRRTAATASAHIPQAAQAANIASADTHCQIAAGPITRNGAASRACDSAPSTFSVCSTATAVEAAMSVTTRPAASPLPRPSRASTTKKVSAPGGWPAMCTGHWPGESTGIRLTYSARVAGRSVVARAVFRYSYGWSSTSPTPPTPSTIASASIQASPPAYAAPSRRPHDSRAARSTAYRHASTPSTTAGTVPQPTRGSQSACNGGNHRTCTSQSRTAGTAIPRAASTSARTRPTRAARTRRP